MGKISENVGVSAGTAELCPMDNIEFAKARASLGKSQRELAELLGVSLKAVESYEQGWRKIPSNIERMLFFLLFKVKEGTLEVEPSCWVARSCPDAVRDACVAYVVREGHFCWFYTGGLCAAAKGAAAGDRYCYGCEVFKRLKERVEGSIGTSDKSCARDCADL